MGVPKGVAVGRIRRKAVIYETKGASKPYERKERKPIDRGN